MAPTQDSEIQDRLKESTKGDFLPRSRFTRDDFQRTFTLERRRAVAHSKQGTPGQHSRLHNFRLGSIRSLSTFMEQLNSIPPGSYQEYGARFDVLRLLAGHKRTEFVGQGYSFSVNIISNRAPISEMFGEFPEMKLEQHETIAIKVPKIEPVQGGSPQRGAGLRAYSLQAVAWEAHCLFHPPVRQSPYVVQLLGLSWEAAQEIGSGAGEPDDCNNWTFVPGLVMEYADQGTLDDLLQSNSSTVEFELKLKLLSDIAQGLQALHGCGIVHCDLKATNVLLFSSPTEKLVAKISDFGCAAHDFGVEDTTLLPPYWPRWDAPEVRQQETPINIEDLPAVDVYPLGLIAWQFTHDGKTPFDRGRSPAPLFREISDFVPILDALEEEDKKVHIANLKDMEDDGMLEAVMASVKLLGLDDHRLDSILSNLLRRNPAARWNIGQICEHFKRNRIGTNCQEEATVTTNNSISNYSRDTLNLILGPSSEAPPSTFSIENAMLTLELDIKARIFYGTDTRNDGANAFDLIINKEYVLDWPQKTILYEEFREAAAYGADQRTTAERSSALLRLGLSEMIGYGCEPNPKDGARRLYEAAEMGSRQARALAWRLGEASCCEAMVDESALREWLAEATSQGSLIAYNDLRQLDPKLACENRKHFLAQNFGRFGDTIYNKRGEISDKYVLHHTELFESKLDECDECDDSDAKNKYTSPLDNRGHTILHYAAALGCFGAVNSLIGRGADLNVQSQFGETALMYACRCGHAEIVRLLLTHGADVKKHNFYRATALHYLVYLNEGEADDIATSLIKEGADIHAASSPTTTHKIFLCEEELQWGTPLHWAVVYNRKDIVRILLDHGADPLQIRPNHILFLQQTTIDIPGTWEKGMETTSPIHLAAKFHRREILEALIGGIENFGAEADLHASLVKEAMSTPLLRMMCENGASYNHTGVEVINLVKGEMSDNLLMENAISSQKLFYVKHLVESGYELDQLLQAPWDKSNALIRSLAQQNGDITLYLLEKGASPAAMLYEKYTPLAAMAFYPEAKHRDQIVRMLIRNGCPADTSAPLYMRAVIDGWEVVADELVRPGLRPDDIQRSLYRILLEQNSEESIRGLTYLLNHVSNDFLQDPIIDQETGNTVLHQVVIVDEYLRNDSLNDQILQMMLTKFSDSTVVNMLNKRGVTAVTAAAEAGIHKAVKTLLDAGARYTIGEFSHLRMVLGRILLPDQFLGDTSTLSSRGRKYRKYQENTLEALSLLLHLWGRSKDTRENVAAVVRAEKETWWNEDFIRDAFQRAVVMKRGDGFELRITKRREQIFEVFAPSSGKMHSFDEVECVVGLKLLWNAIVRSRSARETRRISAALEDSAQVAVEEGIEG